LAGRGDVVVAKTDPPLLSVVAAPIAWLKGARRINWLQDLFPEVATALGIGGKGVAKPVVQFLKAMRNSSLRAADTNVVLGELMAGRVRAVGVADERIRVIANWSDGEQISPIAPENNSLRREWGLSDKFVIGYSGNFGRVHEFDTLLGAMRVLSKLEAARDLAFLFIGGGAQREKLQAAIGDGGFANVLFQPYQPRERLAESLSVADLHLVSLLPPMEGLIVPSKFYGIAAAGRTTAFIGDPEGEIPRLLKQHECGFTVAPGECERLALQLIELAAEPMRCREMGARARALFEREYDQKIAFEKWEALLDELK
jgi:glycosyltransferase involved in cell wall biosynthesis